MKAKRNCGSLLVEMSQASHCLTSIMMEKMRYEIDLEKQTPDFQTNNHKYFFLKKHTHFSYGTIYSQLICGCDNGTIKVFINEALLYEITENTNIEQIAQIGSLNMLKRALHSFSIHLQNSISFRKDSPACLYTKRWNIGSL